jgi:hypothetical protein
MTPQLYHQNQQRSQYISSKYIDYTPQVKQT